MKYSTLKIPLINLLFVSRKKSTIHIGTNEENLFLQKQNNTYFKTQKYIETNLKKQ